MSKVVNSRGMAGGKTSRGPSRHSTSSYTSTPKPRNYRQSFPINQPAPSQPMMQQRTITRPIGGGAAHMAATKATGPKRQITAETPRTPRDSSRKVKGF